MLDCAECGRELRRRVRKRSRLIKDHGYISATRIKIRGGPEYPDRLAGLGSRYQVNWALICSMRGEASPPRNDPTMLVGVLTVLMIVPKLELATSFTG